MNERQAQIVKASWVSILGNAILSALKIIVGIIAGSLAVVGDGIDSGSDIITSIITLLTARILAKPPNKKFPFGYEKADTIATKALSFIIFFAGAQLAISTVSGLLDDTPKELPSMLAIYITIISIFGKLFLGYYQRKIGKKVESAMLLANSKNMQNDVIISLSVLVGLAFTFIFKLPVIDTITALAVSIWIMYSAYCIFMKSNIELMDGVEDQELYTMIFKAISDIKGAYNPHRLRMRKIGFRHMIEIDIEVDGSISVSEAHKIACKVEDKIKETIRNVYDIVVHIEPYGLKEPDEKYGVSNQQINKKP
jgi:cation diffusion facilitator family transporter